MKLARFGLLFALLCLAGGAGATGITPGTKTGVGVGLLPHSLGVPITVAQSVTFSGQTPGAAATLPAWLSGARASVRYVQTSASSMAASTVASGALAIGQPLDATTTGLLVERGTTNLLPNSNAFTASGWQTVGSATSGITGPDGAASGWHVVAALNSGYTLENASVVDSLGVSVLSEWAKASGSTTADLRHFSGGTGSVYFGSTSALNSSWQRIVYPYTITASQDGYLPQIAIAIGFGGAGGVDANIAFAQLEQQPYATTYAAGGTPRAGERLYTTTASSVAYGGRLRAQISFVPTWGTASLGTAGDASPNRRFWTLDAFNFCELDGAHIQVRCTVGGTPAVFPYLVVWNPLDKVVVRLDVGNGVPVGWITVNGGALTSLGAVATVHPYLRTDGGPALDWLCDATSGTPVSQIDAYVQSITLYKAGLYGAGSTFFASVSGGGSGLASASPTTLAGAQTLAQASPGSTVLLAGGTYRLGSTLALSAADSGTTYQAMPRAGAVVLSGATSLVGTWTNTSGSIWSTTLNTQPTQVYVNGARYAIGHVAVTDFSSWTTNTGAGTWTCSAAVGTALAALPTPTDAVIVAQNSFSYYQIPLTSVSGTTLTADATAWANFISLMGAPFNVSPSAFIVTGYQNVPPQAAGQWYWSAATSKIQVWPKAGDTMSTAIVELGSLQQVVTVVGTLGSKASNIALRSITIEQSGYPQAHGHQSVGSGLQGGYQSGFPATSLYGVQPAMVVVQNATGVTLAGLTVRRTAAAGVYLGPGTSGSVLEGSAIYDTSGTGVYLGDGAASAGTSPDPRAYVTADVIRRNSLTNTGTCAGCLLDSPAIMLEYASGCTVAQNTVTSTGMVGIVDGVQLTSPTPATVVGGNLVAGNRISINCAGIGTSCDAGDIHTGGPQTPTTTLSANYVNPVAGSSVQFYIDNYSSHYAIIGNVTDGTPGGSVWLNYNTAIGVNHNSAVSNYTYNGRSQGLDATDTETGTVTSIPLSPTALTIAAAAGMRVSGSPLDHGLGGVGGVMVVALGIAATMRRRDRRAA